MAGENVPVSLGEILEGSIKDRDPCKERPLLLYRNTKSGSGVGFKPSFRKLKKYNASF